MAAILRSLCPGEKFAPLALFPDKRDDFHAEYLQRFHLCKLLQVPPTQPGLYVSAGRFVNLANQMGWPMNHCTAVLSYLLIHNVRLYPLEHRDFSHQVIISVYIFGLKRKKLVLNANQVLLMSVGRRIKILMTLDKKLTEMRIDFGKQRAVLFIDEYARTHEFILARFPVKQRGPVATYLYCFGSG